MVTDSLNSKILSIKVYRLVHKQSTGCTAIIWVALSSTSPTSDYTSVLTDVDIIIITIEIVYEEYLNSC